MLTQGIRPPEMRFGKLLPSEKMKPEVVFYASTEEEIADSALPRFRRNGGNDRYFAYSAEATRHMTLSEEDVRAAIEATGARLVIIDPLQAFLPSGVSLNNISRMRPIFTALSNAALATGAAIVLLGQVNKNEYAKDIHRGFGSADIAAVVRSIILIDSVPGQPALPRTIRCIKSNFDESDFSSIKFSLDEERKIHLMDGEPTTSYQEEYEEEPELTPQEVAAEFLLDLLSEGSVEASEVVENLDAAGISKRTADRAKKKLGIKSIRRDGKYFWKM